MVFLLLDPQPALIRRLFRCGHPLHLRACRLVSALPVTTADFAGFSPGSLEVLSELCLVEGGRNELPFSGAFPRSGSSSYPAIKLRL